MSRPRRRRSPALQLPDPLRWLRRRTGLGGASRFGLALAIAAGLFGSAAVHAWTLPAPGPVAIERVPERFVDVRWTLTGPAAPARVVVSSGVEWSPDEPQHGFSEEEELLSSSIMGSCGCFAVGSSGGSSLAALFGIGTGGIALPPPAPPKVTVTLPASSRLVVISDKHYDPRWIRHGLAKSSTAIRTCYGDAVKADPSLEGTAEIEIHLGEWGTEPDATVTFPESPALEACVERALERNTYRLPAEGTVDARFPVIFTLEY